MKTIISSLFTLLLVFAAGNSLAQVSKLEAHMDDESYARVVKLAEKYMSHDEYRKDPKVYYLHAQALFELSKDDYYFEKHPDLIKRSVKSVFKGMKKDEDSAALQGFLDFIDELAVKQNEMAEAQYNINKYSKSRKMYQKSYDLNANRTAYLMVAKNYLAMEDSTYAEEHFKQLVQWYNADLAAEDDDQEQTTDAHIYFINKYWLSKNYDSAIYYLDNARAIFGNDTKINFYQRKIGLEHLNTMPPSALMMEYIQKNIQLFPTDTNFLHKENALYIYLIKNHILSQRYFEVDTMLKVFAAEKKKRSYRSDADLIMEGDEFVSRKTENVYWKLAEYFNLYGHVTSAKYILGKYIKSTASDTTEEAIANRWETIAEHVFQSKDLPYASFVLRESIVQTNQNADLLNMRSKVIEEQEVTSLTVDDAAALYGLMKDEYALVKDNSNLDRLEAIGGHYLNMLVKNVRFSTAKEVLAELKAFSPHKNYSETEQLVAQEDFYQNYFLTKTKGKDESGNVVDAFVWDGQIGRCDPGTVDPAIQQKVLSRINYFRRNAGVPEVLFDANTNEYCQQAALMMTANNRLDHNPSKSWRCYTPDGAYAAQYSLLVKNSNTSIAVTSLMADQSNPTVGNRRWLLYPNGRIYGHGSTNNVAVIWALDDSGTTDTAEYMDKAICWPPQGYVPQMMLFKHWSFSMYRNMDSATVSVAQDGEALQVIQEKVIDGYGVPTLVFRPQYDPKALPNRSTFEVTVTLSDGSQYSYAVRTFSYDPNKD